MKITKTKLKQIIREELQKDLQEAGQSLPDWENWVERATAILGAFVEEAKLAGKGHEVALQAVSKALSNMRHGPSQMQALTEVNWVPYKKMLKDFADDHGPFDNVVDLKNAIKDAHLARRGSSVADQLELPMGGGLDVVIRKYGHDVLGLQKPELEAPARAIDDITDADVERMQAGADAIERKRGAKSRKAMGRH